MILVSKSAEHAGIGGPEILEQRFSIHPSPRSADYTTIKQTLNTADGKSQTSAMLTDAVKRKNGYSILFARRVQDLRDAKYILPLTGKPRRIYTLAEYNPEFHCLYFAVFLGHPDSVFDARSDGIVVSHFPFREFKIVILMSLDGWPSHSSTHYTTAVTVAPEITEDDATKAVLRSHMAGKSPEICLHQYLNSLKTLIRLYWEAVLPELDNPELIKLAHEKIAEVSDVELTEVKLGTETLSTHMLSGGKPPNLR